MNLEETESVDWLVVEASLALEQGAHVNAMGGWVYALHHKRQ